MKMIYLFSYMIFDFFLVSIIKTKKLKYNYHDKIMNNLMYTYARRMNLYSLERRNRGLSNKPKTA